MSAKASRQPPTANASWAGSSAPNQAIPAGCGRTPTRRSTTARSCSASTSPGAAARTVRRNRAANRDAHRPAAASAATRASTTARTAGSSPATASPTRRTCHQRSRPDRAATTPGRSASCRAPATRSRAVSTEAPSAVDNSRGLTAPAGRYGPTTRSPVSGSTRARTTGSTTRRPAVTCAWARDSTVPTDSSTPSPASNSAGAAPPTVSAGTPASASTAVRTASTSPASDPRPPAGTARPAVTAPGTGSAPGTGPVPATGEPLSNMRSSMPPGPDRMKPDVAGWCGGRGPDQPGVGPATRRSGQVMSTTAGVTETRLLKVTVTPADLATLSGPASYHRRTTTGLIRRGEQERLTNVTVVPIMTTTTTTTTTYGIRTEIQRGREDTWDADGVASCDDVTTIPKSHLPETTGLFHRDQDQRTALRRALGVDPAG